MTDMLRFPSVPLVGLPLLGDAWTVETAALPGQEKGPAAASSGKGEQPAAGHSPRSWLDNAAAFSSHKSSAAHSAGSYSVGRSGAGAESWLAGESCDSEDDDALQADGAYGCGSLTSEDAEQARTRLRRSARNHASDGKRDAGEPKRKVGRPIIYVGDPDAPDLAPAERRRIRRRIANRESARRVRARRQDLLEEMAIKAREMEQHNAKLLQRAQSVENKHQAMLSEVAAMNEDLARKCTENEALQAELVALKASLTQKANDIEAGGDPIALGAADFQPPDQAIGMMSMAAPHMQQAQQPLNIVSSGFGSPFGVLSGYAQLPGGDMLAGPMRGGTVVPAVTTGQPVLPTAQAPAQPAAQLPGQLRAPSIEPAALTFSLDRSLSEFLNQVACF